MITGYGHIVLAQTKHEFTALAVRFFTAPPGQLLSNFSHSFVTMPSILGVPMCAEDSGRGVNMLRFDTGYLQNPDTLVEVWQVNIPQEAKIAGLMAVINSLEQPYGYFEIPWFAWRWLNRLFGRDIKAQNNWCQAEVVCSGLVRNKYVDGANSIYPGLTALWGAFGKNSVAPQDLRDVMVTRPDLFTLVYSNFT